jgi:hypothetical protein
MAFASKSDRRSIGDRGRVATDESPIVTATSADVNDAIPIADVAVVERSR